MVFQSIGKAIVASDSWQEYVFLFNVASPGPRRFGINGIGRVDCPDIATYGDQRNCDHTSCIDAVSLKRVREAFEDTPRHVSDKIDVEVAQGASLRLDFPGTMTISKLRLGGALVRAGVVTAEDYPQYLSGRGSLEIVPTGMCIFVR